MRHVLAWMWLTFLTPLFASCIAAPRVASNVETSSYSLVYDLASNYELKISSPDLNRKVAAQSPGRPRLLFPSDNGLSDPSITSLENLKISLDSDAPSPQAGLLLKFSDDEGRLLDRAELDTRVVDEAWALGLGLSSRTTWGDEGVPAYALGVSSELSGLWAPSDGAVVREGHTLRIPEKTGVRSFAQASGIAEDDLLTALAEEGVSASSDSFLDAEAWQLIGQRFGLAIEPRRRHYLGFHDVAAGLGDDGTRTLLLSLGGFLPEWGGELVTTYRLLQNDEDSGSDRAGFTEQALGLTYVEHFERWLKSFSHSLSYFDYRENDLDEATSAGAAETLAQIPEDGERWRNSTLLSAGSDLDFPFLGLIKGYRMDLSYETETIVLRSESGDARRNTVVGSHLKIKTDLGTFYGRVQQSEAVRKLMFGVQKQGWADSQFKLYVEDINPLTSGIAETRVSGQLHVPLERSLFDVFTLDVWKIAEDNLFAPLRRRGYLVPIRGRHVPDLNNSSPGGIP
ncbi:hypothetical protein [Trichloromonas sp.]|uniref:hypothetical protein n=1 Tax=Trichloromonas sp. TaxID=3069249 RepID=UPI003D81A01F